MTRAEHETRRRIMGRILGATAGWVVTWRGFPVRFSAWGPVYTLVALDEATTFKTREEALDACGEYKLKECDARLERIFSITKEKGTK